ncbi:MAG: hypothetical protein KIS92_26440 [Planctomycetota bacterium]|nr:hypothetical protein [Planctomycetota bacterium]
MDRLADALVIAVLHLNHASDFDDERLDEDIQALEEIAAALQAAAPEERKAFADAVRRAYDFEAAGPKREEHLSDLSQLLDEILGEGWQQP